MIRRPLAFFSSIDPSDGGKVHRCSLSAAWHAGTENTATKVNASIINNRLRIYSNFTYFLDDPVNGDQFAQPDNRTSMALNASHAVKHEFLGHPSESTFGIQIQRDAIRNGLLSTKARQLISTTRRDQIKETSVGGFFENTTQSFFQFADGSMMITKAQAFVFRTINNIVI